LVQDVLVIGGGINGAGIARDAAGRGLSVTLCEQSDLASGTSSASTKLIHGGLRYLEHGNFMMVREALEEREVLLRMAPHIIRPLRFVLPHSLGMRPAWMLRLGLLIYDYLGGRKILPASGRIDLRNHPAGSPLASDLDTAFEYSDCWADDSRLVVLNAMDAAERGAKILTRTRVIAAQRLDDHWSVETRDAAGGARTIEARAVVNAGGPWVASVGTNVGADELTRQVRLVKGSHLVTRRLFDGEQAYIFQGADSRIVFAIPYERDLTLVGTTEVQHASMSENASITSDECRYLLEFVGRYFGRPIAADEIIWTFAGVRPLLDEVGKKSSEVSREYVLDLDSGEGAAPMLTVYGGKLTTYRTLSEKAVSKLQSAIGGSRRPWTAKSCLPGGDIENADFAQFEQDTRRRYAWLDEALLHRLLRAYGTRIEQILRPASKVSDLGHDFGAGLHEAEVGYLLHHEFASTTDDLLWRRSKLGLRLNPAQVRSLDRWLGGDAEAANM
jgi:glycerol-3-phosphate dehydrogenase